MEKVTFTPELREKLSGLLPFDSSAEDVFSPAIFGLKGIPKELTPVFRISCLTAGEKQSLRSGNLGEADLMELARKHSVGWKNLYDLATGELVEYVGSRDGGADPEVWERITEGNMLEIAKRVNEISGVASWERLGLG